MAKKIKSIERSSAQKKKDEKLFLKLLKEHERKQTKQKTVKKSRKRNSGISAKKDRKGKTSIKKSKLSEQNKKGIRTKKIGKRKTTSAITKRTRDKRIEPGILRVEKQKKGSKRIDFVFEKVRSIDKKINIFKEQAGTEIKKELKKRGGKPPRGIVVILGGKSIVKKDGKLKRVDAERAEISELTFVVNEENVINFVVDKLERIKNAFSNKMKLTNNGHDLPEDDSGGIFDPDSIYSITIKFII